MRSLRTAALPFVVAAAFTLSSCSDSDGGTPEAEPAQSSAASSMSETSDSSSANSGSPLTGVDPCSLLNTDDVAEHGAVKAPERTTVGNSPTCNWHADAPDTAAAVPSTAIAIRENGGVQAMNDMGQGVEVVEEGGREYGRTPGPDGCAIGIGVTEQSRVDVLVTGVPTGQACDIANALVEKAEPNVPRG